MKFLRSLNEESKVEILDKPSEKEVSAAWPYGVLFNGRSVFKSVYESDLSDEFMGMLEERAKAGGVDRFDAQETYLGFAPVGPPASEKGVFLMGFDVWVENYDDDGDSLDVDDTNNTVVFQLEANGALKNAKVLDPIRGQMFYPSSHNALRDYFPGLIDIRLD